VNSTKMPNSRNLKPLGIGNCIDDLKRHALNLEVAITTDLQCKRYRSCLHERPMPYGQQLSNYNCHMQGTHPHQHKLSLCNRQYASSTKISFTSHLQRKHIVVSPVGIALFKKRSTTLA